MGVHPVVASNEAVVSQVEQFIAPPLDLWLLQLVPVHAGRVLAALVFICQVYPPLAGHVSSAQEVPDHSWPVQS